jgi:MATE family multidrug resistance protein
MISINLLQFGIQLVSLMFVGHLGQLALSSASIASSIATVTGSSFLVTALVHLFRIG